MRKGVAGAYDAAISSLKKQSSLDYRVVVKLLNSKPPLSPHQADELLTTTQSALCDNDEVYKAYLGYHATNTNPETVIKKFNEYKDRALRNSTSSDLHAIVVHALHDTGDMDSMVQVAAELRARGRLAMTTTETESLLLHLARTDTAQCENWWMYLRGMKLNLQPATYNAVLTALARAQSSVALHLLGHMEALGVSPDEEAYAALLRMSDSKHSRTFDRVMNKTRTRDACSALLAQCVRTGRLAHAQELRTLRGTSAFTVASLNLLLAAYAKQGNVARGAALFSDMLERDAVTFEIAANMYARAGDARACRDLVTEMSASCVPVTRGVLLALMDVCVAHGDVKACEQIFEKLRAENDGTSVVYDKMLTLYSNSGDLQKVRDAWELMIDHGISPSTNSYNIIIAAHAKQGKSPDCLRLFQAMKANKLAPNLGTFAGIVTAHVQRRNFRSSRKFFEEMTQAMPVKDALGAIFEYCSLKSSLRNEGLRSVPM
eukprot:Phypoly_transcript_07580.p1 GENE.Phypoly_transcript_07580~~Phypoly_transcript_07580.p1  ORF type:complete len:489 (+),score=125.68 Phypoly_transcript_07580:103-1569(+)